MAGPTCSANARPASVGETLRVVRLNRRTPSCRSSLAIALLSAVVDMPSWSAAARNDPRLIISSTASSSITAGRDIILFLAIPHRDLSRLSRRCLLLNECPHLRGAFEMSIDLPKPIADFVTANARLDVDGMLKPFLPDAVFIDNGKRFDGQAAIRKLFDEEVVPVKAIFTPDTIREEDGQVVVEGPAHG